MSESYLIILSMWISIFSSLTSLLVIIMYITIRSLRNFSLKLVIYLLVSDLCFAIAKIITLFINMSENSNLCQFQGFLSNFGQLSSVIWVSIICYSLKSSLIYQRRYIEKEERYFLMIAFGFPFLLSLIPFYINVYGPTNFWCWIPLNTFYESASRLIFFEIWFIVSFCFCTYWYLQCIYFLKNLYGDNVNKGLIRKLFFFPIILCLCWLWIPLQRIFNNETFNLGFCFFVSAEGIINFFIYAFKKNVREAIKSKFSKEKKQSEENLLEDSKNIELSNLLED